MSKDNLGRRLIYVPILHTKQDMGTLSTSAQNAYIEKFGKKLWQAHLRAIDDMWSGIKKRIQRLKLPPEKVYVYQDGLPVCEQVSAIITDLAEQGSYNHLIVKWLVDSGATVLGTEDPQLLLQEYQYLKQILTTQDTAQKQELIKQYEQEGVGLLKKRDVYICNRINETLPEGGTGLLFLGLLHRADELLPGDIRVSYLIHYLPFQRDFEMNRVQ